MSKGRKKVQSANQQWRSHLNQKLFQVDQPVRVCPKLSERKCRALEKSAMRAVPIPHISWTLEGL